MGDVREKNEPSEFIPGFRNPDRTFGPFEPTAEYFDLCVLGDELIDPGFKPVNPANVCIVRCVLRKDNRR